MTERRSLLTADQRRGAVLVAAVDEFSEHGLTGASTAKIAERAEIAHSYLFKLFRSKRHLFVATTDHVYDRISERFRVAADESTEDPLKAMAAAYKDMLKERSDLLMLLHGFAAASDSAVGLTVRRRYVNLYLQVKSAAGASEERMRQFWAHGMMLTVAAAIELPLMSDEHPWIVDLLHE